MTAHLVDTNVLLRLADRQQPARPIARRAVDTLVRRGDTLHLATQNCTEFWNVATRPADKNGLGLSVRHADRVLQRIEARLALLPDVPAVYPL